MSTLNLPTTKDLFEFVKAHLLQQGERCHMGGLCRYRLGDLSCAVGCLIVDDHYNNDFDDSDEDGFNARDEQIQDAVSKSIGRELTDTDKDLLCELQHLHDDVHQEFWKEALEDLARKYKLGGAA